MKKRNLQTILRMAMALVIAFGVETTASAQFGGLLKKAKSVAKGDVKKDVEAKESNLQLNMKVAENELGISKNSKTASKSSSLNKIYKGTSWDDKDLIATWNDATHQFTLVRTYADGELAGQHVVYTVNESTGEVTRNDGQLMATFKDDEIVFPDRGTLTIDTKRGGGLYLDGNFVGKVTRTDGTSFGKDLFHFRKEATRQLVAFYLMTEFLSPDELAKLKGAREKQRAAEENAQANFKANVRKLTAGKFLDNTGKLLGQITANGDVLNSGNQRIGRYANGKVTNAVSGSNLGSIDANGMVYDHTGSPIGRLQPNGAIDNKSGSNIGHIYSDGRIENRQSSKTVRFTGEGRYIAAALSVFFFDIR